MTTLPPHAPTKHPSIRNGPLFFSIASVGDMSHLQRKLSPAAVPKRFQALEVALFNYEPRTPFRHTVIVGARTSRVPAVRMRCFASNLVFGLQARCCKDCLGDLGPEARRHQAWQLRWGVFPAARRRFPRGLCNDSDHSPITISFAALPCNLASSCHSQYVQGFNVSKFKDGKGTLDREWLVERKEYATQIVENILLMI